MFKFIDSNTRKSKLKGFGSYSEMGAQDIETELNKIPLDVQKVYKDLLKDDGQEFNSLLNQHLRRLGAILNLPIESQAIDFCLRSRTQDEGQKFFSEKSKDYEYVQNLAISGMRSTRNAILVDAIDDHIMTPANLVLKYDKENNLYRLHLAINYFVFDSSSKNENGSNSKLIFQPLYEIAYELAPDAVQLVDSMGATIVDANQQIIGDAKKIYRVNIMDRHSKFQWRKNYVLNNALFEKLYNTLIQIIGEKVLKVQKSLAVQYRKENNSAQVLNEISGVGMDYLQALNQILPNFSSMYITDIEKFDLPIEEKKEIGAFFLNMTIRNEQTNDDVLGNPSQKIIDSFIRNILFMNNNFGKMEDKTYQEQICSSSVESYYYGLVSEFCSLSTNDLFDCFKFKLINPNYIDGPHEMDERGLLKVKESDTFITSIVADKKSIPSLIGLQIECKQIPMLGNNKMYANQENPIRVLPDFRVYTSKEGLASSRPLYNLVDEQIVPEIVNDFSLYIQTLLQKQMTDSLSPKMNELQALAKPLEDQYSALLKYTEEGQYQKRKAIAKEINLIKMKVDALNKMLPTSDSNIKKVTETIAKTSQCSNNCFQQVNGINYVASIQNTYGDDGVGVSNSSGISIPMLELKELKEIERARKKRVMDNLAQSQEELKGVVSPKIFDRIRGEAQQVQETSDETYDSRGETIVVALRGFVLPYMGNTYVQPLGLGQVQTNKLEINQDTGLTDIEEEAMVKSLDDLSMLLQAKANSYNSIADNEDKFRYVPLSVEGESETIDWKKLALYGLGALSIGSLAYILYKHHQKNK